MPTFNAPDGTTLYYEDQGEGDAPPLLCLSGLTRNARDFDFVAPHLTGVRMIRMDYRGRGKSNWADHATYEVPVEAGDALALLDHLGIHRAAVLGTSRGGIIAMVLAATARDRLCGVALNDVGPVLDPGGLGAIKSYLGINPAFATLEDAAEAQMQNNPRFANVPKSRWVTFMSHINLETTEGLRINYDPKLRDAVVPGFDAPQTDLWPLFDRLEGLPLAIIHGANSDLLSEDTLAEMIRRHPGAIVAQVPDRGHIPFLDEPEALTALREWQAQLA